MKVEFATISGFLNHGFDEVIDVRSPSEFGEDHVPGAINLPVLSDEQRARVGTMYKQQSPFEARIIGAALVARNAAAHLEGPLANKQGDWRPLVYCWRGGQRSGSFATILGQVGWRVGVVDGGYKTWRRLVADALHDRPLPHRLILLDGNTGTAKTGILHRMAAMGAQVLDLEGLACHRGSVFGPMSDQQPAQKAFESALAVALSGFDPDRPVFAEAESSTIGQLQVPPSLWEAMKIAPRVEVSAPLPARADYLVTAYGDIIEDGAKLAQTLSLLTAIQGHERVTAWQSLAKQGAYRDLAAQLMQQHYDPRYSRWRAQHEHPVVQELALDDLSDATLNRAARQMANLKLP